MNFLFTDQNRFAYSDNLYYIQTYAGYKRIDKSILSDHIIEQLNNNPFSVYQDKERHKNLPVSYHNLNFVVNGCLINGVNYDNTINMFVDNISCQLCRYEVSDSFWNKLMSNVKTNEL